MRIICWLKTLWRSFGRPGFYEDGTPIDGCDYVEKEIHRNCIVKISECEHCGKIDFSWEEDRFYYQELPPLTKEEQDYYELLPPKE